MRTFLIIAALLTACAPPPPAAPEPPPPPPVETSMANSRWTLAVDGANAPTIEFTDGRAAGDSGCNRWFAQVTRTGDALSFGAVGSTRRMCPPPQMEIERAFLGVLRDTRTARTEENQLVFRNEAGEVIARFNRAR